jgi:hypothetical protein
LLDRAPERTEREFTVHRDYTASFSTTKNDVAAFLANYGKSQSFESLDGIPT